MIESAIRIGIKSNSRRTTNLSIYVVRRLSIRSAHYSISTFENCSSETGLGT